MRGLFAAVALFGIGAGSSSEAPGAEPTHWIFVGTYTGPKSKGIYKIPYQAETGKLGEATLAAEVRSPSFLAIDEGKGRLFSVGEVGDFGSRRSGAVSSFTLERASGKLTHLSTVSSVGTGPCHVNLDKTGKFVAVANYGGGSTTILPVAEDGKLGESVSFQQHKGSSVNKSRQEAPHAHSVNFAPDNRFLCVADLGLDKLLVYKFDAKSGEIQPNDPAAHDTKPGAGPRHFAFHPSGKFGYLLNEIDMTLESLAYDPAKGAFDRISVTPTKPDGPQKGESTAEVVVHPSGKFAYSSNRGHHSISVYTIDPQTGKAERIQVAQGGIKTPRNFVLAPDGRFLLVANQDGDSVVTFAVDPDKGTLTPTGESIAVPMPVCLRFAAVR